MPHIFPELPGYAKIDLWLDERNGVEFIRYREETEPYMAMWWHRAANSETGWCVGSFAWRKPDPTFMDSALWDLHSLDPLDVSPSLLCMACGAHGFIEQGKWRPV